MSIMTKEPRPALGVFIRQQRRIADVTQEEVAAGMKALGYQWTRSTVAKVELGQRELEALEALAVLRVILGEWPTISARTVTFHSPECHE